MRMTIGKRITLAIAIIIFITMALGWFQRKPKQSAVSDGRQPTSNASPKWSSQMWYRCVTYVEGDKIVSVSVDVMAEGPDIVYVPSANAWTHSAPAFAREHRDEIIGRLRSVKWNRELAWEESDEAQCGTQNPQNGAVPGSIESTPGGRFIEEQHMFDPGAEVTFAEALKVWAQAEEQLALQASGQVTLSVSGARPNSMFNLVTLPALKRNPNVTLDFK